MIDKTVLQAYTQKAEAELRGNILSFWIQHAVDRQRGGFYGQISNDLQVDEDAIRGSLLSARILWTYSAAYRRYRDPAYLEMARWAYDDLVTRFWDEKYGGLYWSAKADGIPVKARKQIYGQAFGIYGLSEFYRAAGDREALSRAIDLYRAIEAHSYDPEHGGYLEAYTREWQIEEDLRLSDVDMNEKRSMNTHLHVMEAYANLLRAWEDEGLALRQTELVDVVMHRIVDPATYHTITFFDERWTPRSDHISYGHDIEASWLLVESAEMLGDEALIQEARALALHMARATLAEGMTADGGMLYEATPAGIVESNTEWWPQAEAVVGLINAYQLSSEPHFLRAALKSWDYIEDHLVDRTHGEWFRYVTREGAVGRDAFKVSFWKCPYHNGRACMEMIDRLTDIQHENAEA
jgi:mannobiose 2-epimerase